MRNERGLIANAGPSSTMRWVTSDATRPIIVGRPSTSRISYDGQFGLGEPPGFIGSGQARTRLGGVQRRGTEAAEEQLSVDVQLAADDGQRPGQRDDAGASTWA
ncbi:hypothetical protein ACBI99_19275 [Nonomuraea sp. ATR24]|uniref:hypothetical protein n=1 Tax=Nonomuraea TaxID=83681 RepID=UPI001C5DFC79|nr:hypothetical protein [Nonomuraea ceibae]